MPSYILRNIEPDLWIAFKERAEREGHTLRWLFLALLRLYVRDGLLQHNHH